MSPMMCAHMLREQEPVQRGPLKWFNDALASSTRGYVAGAIVIAKRRILPFLLFAAVAFGCWTVLKLSPTAFLPDEDQGVIFAGVQLPEGASRPRTEAVVKPMVQEVMTLQAKTSPRSSSRSTRGDSARRPTSSSPRSSRRSTR